VVFDKTGTLTEGRPALRQIVAVAASEEELLTLAAAAETGSEHPLGRAVWKRRSSVASLRPRCRDSRPSLVKASGRGLAIRS